MEQAWLPVLVLKPSLEHNNIYIKVAFFLEAEQQKTSTILEFNEFLAPGFIITCF